MLRSSTLLQIHFLTWVLRRQLTLSMSGCTTMVTQILHHQATTTFTGFKTEYTCKKYTTLVVNSFKNVLPYIEFAYIMLISNIARHSGVKVMRIIKLFDFEMWDDVKVFTDIEDVVRHYTKIDYCVKNNFCAVEVGDNQWVLVQTNTVRWNAALTISECQRIMSIFEGETYPTSLTFFSR